MDRLIALLSVPPPGLRNFIVFPAVLVFSYTVLISMGPELDRMGLSAFVLAVVFGISASLAWRLPILTGTSRTSRISTVVAIALSTGVVAGLLFEHDPLLCQRLFTVLLGLKAAYLAFGLWGAPDELPLLGGPTDGPSWLLESWAQWKLVSVVMLILVNETAIRQATQTEWIIVWAVAPVIAHCLMHWTILATWGDETDAD